MARDATQSSRASAGNGSAACGIKASAKAIRHQQDSPNSQTSGDEHQSTDPEIPGYVTTYPPSSKRPKNDIPASVPPKNMTQHDARRPANLEKSAPTSKAPPSPSLLDFDNVPVPILQRFANRGVEIFTIEAIRLLFRCKGLDYKVHDVSDCEFTKDSVGDRAAQWCYVLEESHKKYTGDTSESPNPFLDPNPITWSVVESLAPAESHVDKAVLKTIKDHFRVYETQIQGTVRKALRDILSSSEHKDELMGLLEPTLDQLFDGLMLEMQSEVDACLDFLKHDVHAFEKRYSERIEKIHHMISDLRDDVSGNRSDHDADIFSMGSASLLDTARQKSPTRKTRNQNRNHIQPKFGQVNRVQATTADGICNNSIVAASKQHNQKPARPILKPDLPAVDRTRQYHDFHYHQRQQLPRLDTNPAQDYEKNTSDAQTARDHHRDRFPRHLVGLSRDIAQDMDRDDVVFDPKTFDFDRDMIPVDINADGTFSARRRASIAASSFGATGGRTTRAARKAATSNEHDPAQAVNGTTRTQSTEDHDQATLIKARGRDKKHFWDERGIERAGYDVIPKLVFAVDDVAAVENGSNTSTSASTNNHVTNTNNTASQIAKKRKRVTIDASAKPTSDNTRKANSQPDTDTDADPDKTSPNKKPKANSKNKKEMENQNQNASITVETARKSTRLTKRNTRSAMRS